MRPGTAASLVFASLLAGPAAVPVRAADPVGQRIELAAEPGPHLFWISDLLLRRSALVDADRGAFLGMVSGGVGIIAPHAAPDGRELYLAETHYARGTRGERSDVVTVRDARTLDPIGEVAIPPKRAEHASGVASSALSDDGRFLAVFNLTPAQSLSLVDLPERRFAGEIATPGCSLVYPAGPRRFLMLCGDGSALAVAVDERGALAGREKTEPFFDPQGDPVTEKAVRRGGAWLFVSFAGRIHPVDVSGDALGFGEPWPLFDEAARRDGWRIGGQQHLALHEASGRLYALVHRGGVDTHKQAGTEVWVYDLERRARVQRIALRSPTAALLREALNLPPEGLIARVAGWLLALLPNPGVDRILVTQDPAPVLLAATGFPATLAVYDARSGEHLRDVREAGVAAGVLTLP